MSSGPSTYRLLGWAKSILLVAVLLAQGAATAQGAEYFIDPNGSPTGAGTIGDPWDIYKLNSPYSVAPGDTVWLRGGTYYWPVRDDGQAGFRLDLRGDANNSITVRNYNGEHAIIDGGLTTIRDTGVRHVRLWGLDITVSEFEDPNNDRTSTQSGSWPTDLDCPNGGLYLQDGVGLHVINCYVHHARNSGIGWWGPLDENSSIHGTIVYSNGWIGTDRWHGHGIYSQNETGSMRYITQTMFIHSYGNETSLYGSSAATVNDYTLRGNICAGHPDKDANKTLIGGGSIASIRENTIFDENICYRSPLWVGWQGGTKDFVVTNNKVIRGVITYFGTHENLVTSGNVEWSGSTAWTDPPIVDLRVNDYEVNRANLCLIQPGGSAATIPVDFGSWLRMNDVVELRDVTDLYGPPVFTGTYTGSPLDVPVGGAEFSAFVCFATWDNQPPVVDAGTDFDFDWPTNETSLDGTVTDDGKPAGVSVTPTWTVDSGPGTVTFANAGAADTTVTFSTYGTFVLRLTADDTHWTSTDTVTVTVVGNHPPVVNAGADSSVTMPNSTWLIGSVTDDGLPLGVVVTPTWTKESGPGTVTFGDIHSPITSVQFSAAGVYVLKLAADDTEFSASDTVTIGAGEDLLVHLKLDETTGTVAQDATPYNHDGAVTGGGWSAGAVGGALELDEADDSVVVPYFSWSRGPTFTLAFWFKPTDNDGSALQYLFYWGRQSGLAGGRIIVWLCEDDHNIGGYLRTDVGGYGSPDTAAELDINDPNSYLDGGWHHYCLTMSPVNGPKVYLDGELKAQDPNRRPSQIMVDSDFCLGTRDDGAFLYGGGLDDVRFYSRTLDANEVAVLAIPNQGPAVDAGADQAIAWPVNTALLDGTVSDDGSPPGETMTILWTDASGPGAVTFADDGVADTTATFATDGTYVLELYAFDGELSGSDLMEVIVDPANTAPQVYAGADQLIPWPQAVATVDGLVLDDELPRGGSLTTTWTLASGPGSVQFADASAINTDVTFSGRGEYVLRLTASDGDLSASDDVEVIAAIEADFDGDGLITSDDVDLLYAVLETTVPPTDAVYDLSGDGEVTMADATELVEVIVGTSMADTNLDMTVDIQDLGNLANTYNASGTFSDGDTNGDGMVDLSDLGNLASDYGKTFSPPPGPY